MDRIKVHAFVFTELDPSRYTRDDVARTLRNIREIPGVVALYLYDLEGLYPGINTEMWLALENLDALQDVGWVMRREGWPLRESLWGLVRPSRYTGKTGISVQIPGPRLKYLVVYPFVKTHDWYQLPADVRRVMMQEHARVGHAYRDIEQILVYGMGLAPWEFVVGYETDDLAQFSELVMAMRQTSARVYTKRDTPIYTGRRVEEGEFLERFA